MSEKEKIDHIVVNENGEEVVELQIDEFEAMTEAIHMYQKENSLLEVHNSQLQDRINFLEEELKKVRQNHHKEDSNSSTSKKPNKNLKIIADHINFSS